MKVAAGRICFLSLLMAALLFWAVFLGQAEDSVFGRVPILDEIYYLDQAAVWTATHAPPEDPFFVSPLYPLLIALTGSGEGVPDSRVFTPDRLRGIRLLQISCWLGILFLLRLVAGRVLGREKGRGWSGELFLWLPALLFALYRPAAVYTVSILLELPLVLMITASVHLMIMLVDQRRDDLAAAGWFQVLVLGAVIGLAGLLRGTALLLLLPAFLAAAGKQGGQQVRLGRGLVVLAAAAVVFAPATLHNSRLAGGLTAPTLNAGVNLFIGNGPEANGFYVAVVPGDWRRDPAGREFLGERWGQPAPSLAEADRIWSREARRVMVDSPGRTAGLWLKKFWLHLQGWEIDQLTPLAGWRQEASVLAWLPVPFALIVALGLGGVVGRWRDERVRWLAAAIFVLVAGQSFFFVVSRYRLALVPAFCLLAVVGAAELWRKNRRAMIATVLAVLFTVPWGLDSTRAMWQSQAQANEARRWAEIAAAEDSDSARATAERLYRASLEGQAPGPAPWLGLAALLIESGRREEAAAILAEGALATTRNLDINKSLLALWLEDARRNEALALTGRILAEHPRDADTLHNRTILLAETGRPGEGMDVARDLIRAHPADPRGYVDLGIILAREGRRSEARAVFEQGLAAVPGNGHLQKNLELLQQ